MTDIHVRPARSTDALLPAYLAAFADEAVLSWVFPDPGDAAPLLRALLAGLADDQIVLAEQADGAIVGVSVWQLRPGPDPAVPVVDAPWARRLAAIYETVVVADEPHVYLASMAVRPDARGRGIGGRLLAEGLRRADAAGLPTHLEASTERSRLLYLRHGFTDHGRPLPLPEGGPVLRPMRRPPA
ncbi:GNAT family N-acetyltransferase [Asanoa sp. WMMD1127]|uniref:GNAT family N-acetyltransferase n=1 Tax=Asanoa sp. WMMD1127 TaxID=3016107 RepID=UPI0024180635|nr:GNAT family N-acetyltransferase [Asanoa sp. WMMD1127]MDG4824317.1 GNAT family N-acetyltransferase [Asanoa sp. WMMD1127]